MKRLISILLVLTIVSTSMVMTNAKTPTYDEANRLMYNLDVISGVNISPSRAVTRAEWTKMALNLTTYGDSVPSTSNTSPFKDVKYTNWAAPYVKVAVANKIITGYPDGSFRPNGVVTFEQSVTVLLRLLGYQDSEFTGNATNARLSVAKTIGLTKDINLTPKYSMTRGDCMQLLHNLLLSSTKSGQKYITTTKYKIVEDIVLLSTYKDDESIAVGKISTSAGLFELGDLKTINNTPTNDLTASLGYKGTAFIKNTDELFYFIPENQKVESYVVYATVANGVIARKIGENVNIELSVPATTTVYYKGAKTTAGGVIAALKSGDMARVTYNTKGNIDYIVFVEGGAIEGPIVLDNSGKISDTYINTIKTIFKNGVTVTADSAVQNDVAYYSKALDTLWVYDNKVSGIYDKAIPNIDMPTSITVSGKTYIIETASAFSKLSSTGNIKIGDTVVLLLGRDDTVVGVLDNDSMYNNVKGIVIGTGKKTFTNSDGNKYTSDYATLLTDTGSTIDYVTDTDYENLLDCPVSLTFKNGKAILGYQVTQEKPTGKIDASSYMLGNNKISSSVNILDVLVEDGKYTSKRIYMQRLNGLNINSSDVLMCVKNEKNEIISLILKNITGDNLQYALLKTTTRQGAAITTNTIYNLDLNGAAVTYNAQEISWTVSDYTPVQLKVIAGKLYELREMGYIRENIITFDRFSLKTGTSSYAVSSDVVCYKKIANDEFELITFDEMQTYDISKLKFYYGERPEAVKTVRVIIVE